LYQQPNTYLYCTYFCKIPCIGIIVSGYVLLYGFFLWRFVFPPRSLEAQPSRLRNRRLLRIVRHVLWSDGHWL
jgi:hypothetical protein